MKNITLLHGQKLLDYIGSLWHNDEIKQSYESKSGPIWDMVNIAARYPLFFYDQSHPIERTQFSSWWRFVQKREYINPAITDLYYLHELCHIASRKFTKDGSFEQFKQNSLENEFSAAVYSEVLVYLSFPTLRAKTFDFEIWADRFIRSGATPSPEWIQIILDRRRQAMLNPDANDPVEMAINKYNVQNEEWMKIWNQTYQKIDNALFDFVGKNYSGFSQEACDELLTFILNNSKEGVAFFDETEKFHNYIKDNLITIHKVNN